MMASTSKQPPRFLPTLTEVVHGNAGDARVTVAGAAVAKTAAPEVDPAAQAVATIELNLNKILVRLEAPLQARIKLAVGELVQAHIEALLPLIQQEVETVVRETVREGVTAELVRTRKAAG